MKLKSTVALLVVLAPLSVFAKDATTTLKVSGWMCDGCPAKTKTALKDVPGVKTVSVDKAKNTASVTYDDAKTKPADLEKAVAAAGFTVDKK